MSIKPKTPVTQAVHVLNEASALDGALIDALEKHAGEMVNGMMSVDQHKAMPALANLLIQMLATWPDGLRQKRTEELCSAIRELVEQHRMKMVQRMQTGGSA